MSFSSKERIIDKLQFVAQQIEFVQKTTKNVTCGNDFMMSMEAVVLFNSTCMCLQTIGESVRQVSLLLGDGVLDKSYPQIPWRSIYALRNIISHEYSAIDPDEIFNIVSADLQPLSSTIAVMIKDLQ